MTGTASSAYRKTPTLREYLLVTQDQPSIDGYLRQGDVWLLSEALGLETAVPLNGIDCALSLSKVATRFMS
ncbi:MAG: hypothetical protein QX198_16940 [Methylococcaceae bacterium]